MRNMERGREGGREGEGEERREGGREGGTADDEPASIGVAGVGGDHALEGRNGVRIRRHGRGHGVKRGDRRPVVRHACADGSCGKSRV